MCFLRKRLSQQAGSQTCPRSTVGQLERPLILVQHLTTSPEKTEHTTEQITEDTAQTRLPEFTFLIKKSSNRSITKLWKNMSIKISGISFFGFVRAPTGGMIDPSFCYRMQGLYNMCFSYKNSSVKMISRHKISVITMSQYLSWGIFDTLGALP